MATEPRPPGPSTRAAMSDRARLVADESAWEAKPQAKPRVPSVPGVSSPIAAVSSLAAVAGLGSARVFGTYLSEDIQPFFRRARACSQTSTRDFAALSPE